MKKYLVIILSISTLSAVAQHELSVYGFGGVSNLRYVPAAFIDKSLGLGGGAGVGYTYFLGKRWGIVTGAEVAIFSATAKAGTINGTQEISDPTAGSIPDYTFEYQYIDYKEKQRAIYLQVPLMLSFTAIKNKDRCGCEHLDKYKKWDKSRGLDIDKAERRNKAFYIAAGVKLGFAHTGSANATAARLSTRGTFAGYAPMEDMDEYGFSHIEPYTVKSDITLGFNLALALEMGIKFALNAKINLYTGLYLDYGLLDVAPNKAVFLQYSKDGRAVISNSLLSSDYVDKVNLLSAGVKVRIGFGW
jgi:hypothetical protein